MVKVQLKSNEIAIGRKEIFSIPSDSEIRLPDIKKALLERKYSLEQIEKCLRELNPLATYSWSAINIFANHNELTIYADIENEEMVRRLLNIFQKSFKCKTPHGDIRKTKDLNGREIISLTIVRDLF